MRDNETLEFLPTPAAVEGAQRTSPSLVFVGFQITWAKRIADLEMNIRMGERWEPESTHWHINERTVHLCRVAHGYAVDLLDGSATFSVYRPDQSLSTAREHIAFLLQTLHEAGREKIHILCEVQYLEPVESAEFQPVMTALAARIHNEAFVRNLGATFRDFGFYADLDVGGQAYSTKMGVLRASEVATRVVSARYLPSIPNVSRFHGVTAKAAVDNAFSLDSFLNRLFALGDAITHEVGQQ